MPRALMKTGPYSLQMKYNWGKTMKGKITSNECNEIYRDCSNDDL